MRRYILYVDESGIASLTNKTAKYFILTGLLIDSSKNSEISAYFSFIKRKCNLNPPDNFHSYDLFENKKSQEISEILSSFITTTPLRYNIVMLNKYKLKRYFGFNSNYFKGSQERKKDKEIGYDILASKLFFWFAGFLSKQRAIGEIIIESRGRPDAILFDTYLNCREPDNFTNQKIKNLSKKCQRWIVSIRFENKIGVCGGLELSDLISYIAYLYITKKLQGLEKKGIKGIWKSIKKNNTLLRKSVIKEVKKSEFIKYLKSSRVRKISNNTIIIKK